MGLFSSFSEVFAMKRPTTIIIRVFFRFHSHELTRLTTRRNCDHLPCLLRVQQQQQQHQQRERCSSDTSVRTAAEEAAERARHSCISRRVHLVSPVDLRPNCSSSESTTSTTTTTVESGVSAAAEFENTNYNSEGAGEVARVGGAGGRGRGGRESGSRAIMRRWSSRRLEQKMATREPARSNGHGGHGGGSPNRLHPRRCLAGIGASSNSTPAAAAPPPPGAGAAAVAAVTTTKEATAAAVATPELARRLGQPRSFPHASGVVNQTTGRRAASGSDLSAADSSQSPSLSLSPSPSHPSPAVYPYSLLDANPQHVVASMLLNEGGGGGVCGGLVGRGVAGGGGGGGGGGCCGVEMEHQQQQHEVPASPTASVSSDTTTTTAPGWAERAGLTGGVTAACTATSPLGRESTIGGAAKGGREVPRFLRPVILLLTLSLLAIVGTSVVRGRGGGRGVVFGPAVQAAGGVQLPEEVVDDIFDRADKDRDGVIAGEEIRHVSFVRPCSCYDNSSCIRLLLACCVTPVRILRVYLGQCSFLSLFFFLVLSFTRSLSRFACLDTTLLFSCLYICLSS